MRVLVCSAARFGIANVVYNTIEEMRDSDIEITYCRNPLNPSPDWCETIDLLDERKYKRISSALPESFVYRPTHLMYGILWYWRKAFQYIRKHDSSYDIIWLHSPHPAVFYLNPDCADNIVVTLHSESREHLERAGIDRYYYKLLHRLRMSVFDRSGVRLITGVGPDVTRELEEEGIATEKIRLIQNGVDIDRFKPAENKAKFRSDFGLPEDDRILLSLGRFTEQKRPEKIVEMFATIEAEHSDVTLVMAGEGELLPSVKQRASELGVENIVFLGFVPEERKPQLYAGSDVFILSSRYEAGYPPLTLSEAMASGLPCIVADIRCAEIVREAECGLVVDFDSPTADSQISEYLSGRNYEHQNNAREYAKAELSWRGISKKYLESFQSQAIGTRDSRTQGN